MVPSICVQYYVSHVKVCEKPGAYVFLHGQLRLWILFTMQCCGGL